MRYLISGGCGYIGARLVMQSYLAGHRLRIVDSYIFGNPFAGMVLDVRKGDICDPQPEWFDGIDVVSHLAGISNDPTADFDPAMNYRVNCLGTIAFAKMAKECGVKKFIFASSASIYDGITDHAALETDRVRPNGYYSESKYAAESAIRGLADPSFDVISLRQATVFGYSKRMRYDLVVNTMVKDALLTGELRLHKPGTQMRPLVSVRDVAMAHLAVATGCARHDLYNVVSVNHSISTLAMIVASAIPGTRIIQTDPPEGLRQRDYACSDLRYREEFGVFRPTGVYGESVEHAVDEILSRADRDHMNDPIHYNIRWLEQMKAKTPV